jgi:4-hydroxy-tetrahydrodipicolinate synthase
MIGGIWSAALTPVDANFSPDDATALPYYHELLRRGCDGINLLGTTGEAMSFSAGQRAAFMEALASNGLPMERMIVGTGAASLADGVRLMRHAFDCGFTAALVMPPFFFRDAREDGIVAFFDALFARTSPPAGRVLLYNFPRMSGITFNAELVDRLIREFPGVIAGMKDSSNDAQLQREVISRQPDLAIMPGSEINLIEAKRRGVAGCISGSVALWPELAQAVFGRGDAAQADTLTRARAALGEVSFIPAMRYLTAKLWVEPAWERTMPPLRPLCADERRTLDRSLYAFRDILLRG